MQLINDLIGCRFSVHGRSKENGFDCYGLAIEVLKRNGIYLPDAFYDTLENKESVYNELMSKVTLKKIDKPQELCIIIINVNGEPTHVGVYIGNGNMIHSVRKVGVIIEPLHRYSKRIKGYYKVSNS